MAIERDILNDIILDLKENYENSRKRILVFISSILKNTENQKKVDIQTLNYLLNIVVLSVKESNLYIKALEKFSFNEVIKAYEEQNKEELEKTEKLKKDVSEKTKGLYG